MKRSSFNENWKVEGFQRNRPLDILNKNAKDNERFVTLPHDAMIEEKTTPDSVNKGQTGYYPGEYYTYHKNFDVPAEWEGTKIILEFKGIYMNSQVFVNGAFAGGQANGYSGQFVSIEPFLNYGDKNEIVVHVNNSNGLNSRWYSGSGIYRNVSLWTGADVMIPVDGIQIRTPDVEDDYAVVCPQITIEERSNRRHDLMLETTIYGVNNEQVAQEETRLTLYPNENETVRQRIGVLNPELWNCDHPNLYSYVVRVVEGSSEVESISGSFGIRRIQLDSFHGFRLNGENVKLRGACIHHDNGVIGACTLEKAEYRRCRQFKEAGFNCLRSSHHPMSKAMLDACDRLGMLVMDELTDMWDQRKNQNDLASTFAQTWEGDVENMIAKDYNHPSVILYSTGNEIKEAGTPRGAWRNRKIVAKIRALDDTRFVTNAINGNMVIMDQLVSILGDIAAKHGLAFADILAGKDTRGNSGGSSGLNAMLSLLVGEMGDELVCHPLMTERLNEFIGAMDIAGYNYMTGRHEKDGKENHNRIVLGTETFPSDIVRLWDIVQRNPHVIGDITWTGYDYLGEAGIGISYYDGTGNFAAAYPDKVAYCGDIDLNGQRRCISYLREIVYGLRKKPFIAVERLDKYGQKVNQTPWAWKDTIASWTWPGFEWKPAKLDIISDADEVELFLNEESLGRKPAGKANGFIACYDITYKTGELKAVNYRKGIASETEVLVSANKVEKLDVSVEDYELRADGADLAFITVGLLDKNGHSNRYEQKAISIEATGAGTLQGFGSADPRSGQSFKDTTWKTYDGYVMAVIRAGVQPGNINVKISAPGVTTKEISIKVN